MTHTDVCEQNMLHAHQPSGLNDCTDAFVWLERYHRDAAEDQLQWIRHWVLLFYLFMHSRITLHDPVPDPSRALNNDTTRKIVWC